MKINEKIKENLEFELMCINDAIYGDSLVEIKRGHIAGYSRQLATTVICIINELLVHKSKKMWSDYYTALLPTDIRETIELMSIRRQLDMCLDKIISEESLKINFQLTDNQLEFYKILKIKKSRLLYVKDIQFYF